MSNMYSSVYIHICSILNAEWGAYSKCNAFFVTQWGISFSVVDVWLAASKIQWKHRKGESERGDKRMPINGCLCATKRCWSDDVQMHDAHALKRRQTADDDDDNNEWQSTKHNVFLHHYLHWFVFTIVIILLPPVSLLFFAFNLHFHPYEMSIWNFGVLVSGWFWLFICLSYLFFVLLSKPN